MRLSSLLKSVLLATFSGLWLVGSSASLALSNDQVNTNSFAMETKVFVGDGEKPVLTTETLFLGKQAYYRIVNDGAGADSEGPMIKKFDLKNRTVEIIDREKEVRVGMSFDFIDQYQAQASAMALKYGGLAGFMAKPSFQRVFDAPDKTIRLESPWMTYEAVGKQAPGDLVERYADFATWSVKLSTMIDKAPPAQARVQLNQRLKKLNWQVVEIRRIGGPKASELGRVRSVSTYRFALNEADEEFIREFEKDLSEFEDVSSKRFCELQKPARVARRK